MTDHEVHVPDANEPSIPELEDDQTVAPRPEEEIADELRAQPDVSDRGSGFDVRTRDMPERQVVCEKTHVTVDGLDSWIAGALARQSAAIEAAGGVVGQSAVIFYGEVGPEKDGPIEVITPFEGVETLDAETRPDPERREAYLTVTKAQYDYPEILGAYDALESWVAANAVKLGPSREIVIADVAAAGAGDLVCEIALPIAAP